MLLLQCGVAFISGWIGCMVLWGCEKADEGWQVKHLNYVRIWTQNNKI